MMMRMVKRTKGIGLLELMLSLAIIAVLLIMATRYFQGARSNQQINQAIQAFQDVYAACSQAQLQDPGSDCKIPTLVSAGYLSAGYQAASSATTNPMNPFGGDLTASITSGALSVVMTDVPTRNNICTTIARQTFTSLSTGQKIQIESGGGFTAGSDSPTDVKCDASQGDTAATTTITVDY